MPRRLPTVLLACAILGLSALAAVEFQRWREAAVPGDAPVDIGGPFTMTAHDGRTVTERDLLGRRSLIFFGFTHCPDICPTTLNGVATWLDALGDEARLVDPYFVTVDPARDTPERLAEYVGHFSPRIAGLAGTETELARMAESYRLYYARIDLDDGDYTMDHTAAIYLMDAEGRFFDAITHTATFDEAVAKLRLLIDEG